MSGNGSTYTAAETADDYQRENNRFASASVANEQAAIDAASVAQSSFRVSEIGQQNLAGMMDPQEAFRTSLWSGASRGMRLDFPV